MSLADAIVEKAATWLTSGLTKDGAVSAVQALAGTNFEQLKAEVESKDAVGELTAAEQVAAIVGDFLPEAKIAEIAILLLIIAIKTYRAGWWHPGQVDDPAAMARDERDHGNHGR